MAPPSSSAGIAEDPQTERSIRAGKILANPAPGDEIVITGLSGTYPNSANVADFGENLFNKMDLVSTDNTRWDLKHPEIPDRGGRILNIEKFDAGFFGIHHRQAYTMDPMGRILLEKAYEAVVDAGMNPEELRGSRTGVFIGSCFSEAEKTWFYEQLQPDGFAVTGCVRSMLANRISYWLGVDGPSYTVDTACSSSLYALEHAYRAIRTGQCETAIVGGSNLCLHPFVTLQFARLGVLNKDGNCKCFDEAADGYTRAEAIIIIVLQKAKNARRVYSQVIHSKTNCDGYKEQGITYPSGTMQTLLLDEFYTECNINPHKISYVEAHGTGTKVGDPEEVGAIETIFCGKDRKDPLWIGSVKSNIGHSEPASGLCSVTKVILAMEAGYLIPNINFNKPRKEMKALVDGRMKVITEKTKWDGGLVAISSFGFGGANCHVLLKSNQKEKINGGIPRDDIPRLVYISGRTEESISSIVNDVASRPLDAEYVAITHEVFKFDIPGHIYRGYGVLTKEKLITTQAEYYCYDDKPLWYVFSGLGSQWLGMGASLMKIPIFSATIERIHKILTAKGVNITDILIKSDPSVFSKQSNVLVAITAIQIALVEIFKSIDIKPKGLVAYSIGNLACGYYDGCLTLEQAILSALYLGQAADKCKNTNCAMISVAISAEKAKKLLVPGLEIACINSEDNCNVTGPTQAIEQFKNKIKTQNIEYKEINTNIAYHSSYVKEIASSALKQLQDLIKNPKEKSENWLSSEKSKVCSAEFISTILSNCLNFEATFDAVPDNAITLEISAQGLLQSSLKRSIHDDSIIISSFDKSADSSEILMIAIGKLYMAGCNPRVERLYPQVQFPVSRGTPMLSSLIKWDHSYDWFVTRFEVQDKIKSGERTIPVTINDEEQEYLTGHMIDGRVLYPATGYLALVWETMGMVRGQPYAELPIVFENVKFHRATNIPKDGRIYLVVMVQKVSGNFEVIEGGTAIVTGRVYVPDDIKSELIELPIPVPEKQDYYVPLNTRDIYKELRLRGYNYSGLFRGLHSCDTTATVGQIKWQNNWVAFMDTILQMQILQEDTRGLFVPTSIQRLSIDVDKHMEVLKNVNEENVTIPVYVYKYFKSIICGGVEIRGLNASAIGRKKNLGEPVLEYYKFLPNTIENTLSLKQSVRVLLHIVLENNQINKIKTAELMEENADESSLLTPIIVDALADLPLKTPEATVLSNKPLEISGATISDKKLMTETNCVIVMASNILNRNQILQTALNSLMNGGFIIAREALDVNLSELDSTKVTIIADHKLDNERLILLTKATNIEIKNVVDITDPTNQFEWLPIVQDLVKTDPNLLLVAQGDDTNGIIGFMNCVCKEPGQENMRCVYIMDKDAPPFDPKDDFYAPVLKKGLAINIYKNGEWGTYRHLIINETPPREVEHAYVNVTVRGDLSSLRWLEGPLTSNTELDSDRVLVSIYYSAMNFRDIMTATGRIAPEVVAKGRFAQDCVQGLEFAGRLNDGRRVMGMVSHLAMASMITADPQLLWDVPDDWSLEEAVTIPVVYGTVLFGFVVEGKISKGMSVLIHSGSGGVGQAAINIALFYGCTVYTTVGTQAKRDFIKKKWPQIKDNQIGNSHDCSFEQMIMIETNGRGVDIVLNSLAEEKLLASVRCLAQGGKFLEIGKFDLSRDNPLPLNSFMKDISFHGIMLDAFFDNASAQKYIIAKLVKDGLKSKAIKPLERCIFNENEIEEMFRFMASGKHMGKVLIKIREEEPQINAPPSKHLIKAIRRYYPVVNGGSYIIVGGLGGFGLELIDWLVIRGVQKIVITSRKGISTGYQASRVKIWRSYGLDIVISTEDITTFEGCKKIIEEATELGPVEAIFNLAVVLRDAAFENQTKEDFATSFGPKAIATKYLDILSRKMCPELKQFVVFSSVSCGRGNIGQTNYGMSNSIMERICEKRHKDGLPALAVEWGAVGDVGLVAELQDSNTELVIGGTLQQKITNCLAVLDHFLLQPEPLVASMLVAEKRAGEGGAENIVDAVLNILGIRDVKTVSAHSTLAELGMDSIMAVEIKQTLEREFEVFLTPQDIRSMTFARLYEIAAEQETNKENTEEKPETVSETPEVITDMAMHFINRALGDEINSNKPFIEIPSKASPSSDVAILIPGIEGMASVLETVSKHLNYRALCFQLGFKNLVPTLEEMGEILFNNIISTIPDLKSGFTIIAYSYGACLALEVASRLEAKGYIGKLVFIDGAPEMLKAMSRQRIQTTTDEEMQNTILYNITSFIVDKDAALYLKTVYEGLPTWQEKLDAMLKYSGKDDKYSKQHYKDVCTAMYMRITAILSYEPKIGVLKSKFKLIKPKEVTVITEDEDFGLMKFTEHPVEIAYVDGNHILIVENPNTSEEINSFINGDELVIIKNSLINAVDSIKQESVQI